MEAVVLETLGDIDGLDTGGLLEGAHVKDELVCAAAVLVGIQDRVVGLQAGEDVVCVEEGDLGGMGQTAVAHHVDVVEGDGQDAGTAPGSSGDGRGEGVATLGLQVLADWVRGQEGTQVLADTNGSHARTTATVGDTEGLVEVQVAHIGANLTGRAETDLGVHVGTVHVDLATVLVHQAAGLLGTGLEHTEGAGVGDHERSQVVLVLFALGLEVLQIKVTSLGVTLDAHNAHTSHGSTSRVGTMSRDRDQAHVALSIALGFKVLLDNTKTGELTLGTRVGLHSNLGHTGDIS